MFFDISEIQSKCEAGPRLNLVSQHILHEENRILTLFKATERYTSFNLNSTDASHC